MRSVIPVVRDGVKVGETYDCEEPGCCRPWPDEDSGGGDSSPKPHEATDTMTPAHGAEEAGTSNARHKQVAVHLQSGGTRE